MNQTWEKAKKLISGPISAPLDQIWCPQIFLWVSLLLDVRNCRKLSSQQISRKTYDPNSRKWWKTSLFWTWFRPAGPKFRTSYFFFSKIWLRQSLNIMVSYHHRISGKLMMQYWKNLVTDVLTDESDFTGCYPTNVKHPTIDSTFAI